MTEIQVRIQDFAVKMMFCILNLIFLNFFNTNFYLWYNSLLPVKYWAKPIKCIEMRAKIKSVRKIYKIFLCIFTYIGKSDNLPHTPILTKNDFLVTLIAKYQMPRAQGKFAYKNISVIEI